jgi:hypothetical protein
LSFIIAFCESLLLLSCLKSKICAENLARLPKSPPSSHKHTEIQILCNVWHYHRTCDQHDAIINWMKAFFLLKAHSSSERHRWEQQRMLFKPKNSFLALADNFSTRSSSWLQLCECESEQSKKCMNVIIPVRAAFLCKQLKFLRKVFSWKLVLINNCM